MLPIAGPYNIPARAPLPQPQTSFGVGADSADINAKQPGQNWSVQLVAQHSEYADDVIEGHTVHVTVHDSRTSCVRFEVKSSSRVSHSSIILRSRNLEVIRWSKYLYAPG
jgi:hypothetical protein